MQLTEKQKTRVKDTVKAFNKTRPLIGFGRFICFIGTIIFYFQKQPWYYIAFSLIMGILLHVMLRNGRLLVKYQHHAEFTSQLQTTEQHLKEIGRRV